MLFSSARRLSSGHCIISLRRLPIFNWILSHQIHLEKKRTFKYEEKKQNSSVHYYLIAKIVHGAAQKPSTINQLTTGIFFFYHQLRGSCDNFLFPSPYLFLNSNSCASNRYKHQKVVGTRRGQVLRQNND